MHLHFLNRRLKEELRGKRLTVLKVTILKYRRVHEAKRVLGWLETTWNVYS